MLDLTALDPRWTLALGLPIIALLLALAWRRARRLSARIQAVREEMARHPQDPYQALAQLMEEDKATNKATNKTKRMEESPWQKD